MQVLHLLQVQAQFRLDRMRKKGRSILAPFGLPNVKDIAVKIQILNPEANAFHEPEATPVKDFSH